MLGSPRAVVIGATDLDATSRFFELLGFRNSLGDTDASFATALYGVPEAANQRRLAMPDCPHGLIRLVATSLSARARGPFDASPYAVDVYTRDVAASLSLLADAGFAAGPVGRVALGPLVMLQARVRGPDGIPLVLIEANHRRPSRLDHDDTASHSEGHSCVWAVPSVAESLSFWREVAGMTVPFDAPVAHPEISRFLELPRPDVPLRMAMACDEAQSPMRLEFMEFESDSGAGPMDPLPLAAGIHAMEWVVADVDAAIERLRLPALGRARDAHGTLAAVVQAPDGIVAELRRE